MVDNEYTTISISKQTKKELDQRKIIEREPYNDLIVRLMQINDAYVELLKHG